MVETPRQEYIDLIRSFRDRESIRRARSGVNVKVLIAAAAGLLWSVAPHLSVVFREGVMIDQVVALTGILVSIGLLGLTIVVSTGDSGTIGTVSPSKVWEESQGSVRIAFLILFMFGLPIYLMLFLNAEYLGSSLVTATKWLNIVLLGAYLITAIVILISEWRSFAKYGMPSLILQVRYDSTRSNRVGRLIGVVVILSALILNVSVSLMLIATLLQVGYEHLMVALNMSFLFFVILAIPPQFKHGKRDKRLERIEVEAVLGEIGSDRLATVVKDELKGIEFGEWMARRLSDLRELKDIVAEKSSELPGVVAEISGLDREYVDERIARFERFHAVYSAAFDEYLNECQKLTDWMEVPLTMSAARSDPRLAEALRVNFEKFRADFQEVSSLRKENSKAIQEVLSDIRGGGEGE